MHWCACRACGHVFTDGYFTPDAFEQLTQIVNPGQIVGADFERQRVVAARMIEKVLPFATGGLWLDVGFGNGALLMTAHEYGFEAVGCDLRPAAVAALQAVGIEAHLSDIAQLNLPHLCQVISMADVLEHLPYPKTGLAAAHERLADGGVLLLSMPNSDAPAWHLLDRMKVNPHWDEIEHYHNFGRARLYRLLDEMGFVPLRYGISERYRVCMEVIARKISS
ncbi:MAG: class I SAM-dependent methyltransferase [Burkholderiaceae bacterium]|jgi:SAM-dependent methyltransferase|nr:class I SAM-dependent methyltransferase [Burkholderiaceae bacterium]